MSKYVYPALFEKEEDGQYSVSFPDLDGAFTCGHNLAEAMHMAEDCLGIVLYGIEKDKEQFPQASDISNFKNTKNRFATLINIDYSEYKRRVEDKPVRKTLYIPKNLNDQAEALAINFSELMRTALKQRLNA